MPERTMKVAAVQSALTDDIATNVDRMIDLVRRAADRGAQVILMPELFEGHYFPQAQREDNFARARPLADHPTIARFAELAAELEVVLPVSYFEQDGPSYYNSIAIVDADGRLLGNYRKSHIPDGPGYQEKYYFRPGNTGFRAWDCRYGRIGVAICWDQWFPEAARAMAIDGADVLFYPTAIGSEPAAPEQDTRARWQRAMIGHAVSNVVGVVAANRIGSEGDITFYGCSFIADGAGDKLAELGDAETDVAVATLDLDELRRERASFGFFRDRRPSLYGPLTD
jgi:N-carbamoylputrescine amidase